jgi:N-formylglutamate amidohydrolase
MIFHIPHASPHIPPGQRSKITLTDEQLAEELLKITDRFTDELFGCHAAAGDSVVVHSVSRLIVDPERFLDDEKEPLAKAGMGVVYTRTSGGASMRVPPSAGARGLLVDTYYRPHHRRFSDAVDAELKRDGRAVILDCHSFPSKPLPFELDQNPDRPDICIGADDYHTPREILNALEHHSRAEGFSFAVNRPFAGSIVPMAHYLTNRRVRSVMIEVNRRLYLDEKTGAKSASFETCRLSVGRLIEAIRWR